MTAEKIKELLNSTPFRPFKLNLPSGRAVGVPARDFAAISPSGRTMVILGENDSETVIDVRLVEGVETIAGNLNSEG
jgi:hypothetical protein